MSLAGRKREREWGDGRSPPAAPQAAGAAVPPADWPSYFPAPTGDIDVATYDLPQGRSSLEWWYFNCHLVSKQTGGRLSAFTSFFRQADFSSVTEEEAAAGKNYEFFDACTWAAIDVEAKLYIADSALDYRACEYLADRLDPKNSGKKLTHAESALWEMVKENRVPRPDRQLKRPAQVSTTSLDINLDDQFKLTSRPHNPKTDHPLGPGAPNVVYEVSLNNPARECSATLTFVPQRGVVRHGHFGIVNEMMYYYIPRCHVKGTMTVKGVQHDVEGSGWYDREFGGKRNDTAKDALDAWTWFSVQLSDDSEFSLFNITDRETSMEKEKVAVWSDRNGQRVTVTDLVVSYQNLWTSMTTYSEYPMTWKIVCASLQLELYCTCSFDHQEFVTILVNGGGFYEGRLQVTGSRAGKPVTGNGFIERKNHISYHDTEGLLKNVGRFVRKQLAAMYPLDASKAWVEEYVLGRHAAVGTDPRKVCETLFKPVRALTDRGGKSWRSLILVSCMNAISADYVDCSRYIALSELLHVGSLIIDDIQDESSVRRGGKCVHLEYGVATAINAGSACYFMAPILANVKGHPPDMQLELYDLYFDALRAGHAGQGLDILGLDHLMPAAIETGDTSALFDSLRAIHIYKTGGAAGTLCRMGAVLTRASKEQADALENFGVQVGLAFQIVDDALNLRGFEGDLKEVGEDIRDGKITYPIIKALNRLSKSDREYIWDILKEKTDDHGKIRSVIDKLNSVAAIDDCLVEARNYIEDAWLPVNRLLPDTLPKIMMRAFCSYLTERTY